MKKLKEEYQEHPSYCIGKKIDEIIDWINKFQTVLDKAISVEEPKIEKLDKEVEVPEKPTPPKGRIITEGVDPRKQDIDGNKIKKKK